ncbi:MAG: hypothetical protein H7326_09295 [Bdellovibrionaceae bacterium]|nr:hypothetical protein [Pseudobdellovibrionaceae bacterium]
MDHLPLQVNPAWSAQKDQSVALQEFQKIITEFSGVANLTRVTTMVLRGAGDMWAFAGFQYSNGKLSFLSIPRIHRQTQAFVNQAIPADHFANWSGRLNSQRDESRLQNRKSKKLFPRKHGLRKLSCGTARKGVDPESTP